MHYFWQHKNPKAEIKPGLWICSSVFSFHQQSEELLIGCFFFFVSWNYLDVLANQGEFVFVLCWMASGSLAHLVCIATTISIHMWGNVTILFKIKQNMLRIRMLSSNKSSALWCSFWLLTLPLKEKFKK